MYAVLCSDERIRLIYDYDEAPYFTSCLHNGKGATYSVWPYTFKGKQEHGVARMDHWKQRIQTDSTPFDWKRSITSPT